MRNLAMRPVPVLAAILAAALLSSAAAPVPAGTDTALSGEVVDLACYIGHGAKGPDHQKCALKCAQMGQPMGLLSSEGKLYLLVADHADADPFNKARNLAGAQVEIRGEPMEKGGVSILTVHDVKKK